MPSRAEDSCTLHATTVAHAGGAVLIRGASGSGKSALGLSLMALGATLVADDRTVVHRRGNRLIASCPPTIAGLIEARGVGILNARPNGPAPISLIVDLDTPETDRLPPRRSVILLGIAIPLLHKGETHHFTAAVLQYLAAGRSA